jgi:TolB-like protein
MNKLFFTLLFLALTAYGRQERVAIINTLDDYDSISVAELAYLTDKLREAAVNILPSERFGVMTTESIVAFLGSMENTVKVCKESSCLADLGRQVSADYVAQGRLGRFSNNLTIKVELYSVNSGNLMGSFVGSSKDVDGLLALIDEKSHDLFKRMLAEPKPIMVEKPEVAKIEPEPAKPEPEVPKVKPFPRTSFWVAVGLDLVGAGLIVAGYMKDVEAKSAYDDYNNIEREDQEAINDAWKKVESGKTQRNVFYIIGGIILTSGIGVHIWF